MLLRHVGRACLAVSILFAATTYQATAVEEATTLTGLETKLAFQQDVLPVLKKHCFDCHGQQEQGGGVRLDVLSQNMLEDRNAAEVWHEVLNVVSAGKMPPEDASTMTATETNRLTQWLSTNINEAIAARQQTDGRVILRKMNRQE